jgi:hypothetical protein
MSWFCTAAQLLGQLAKSLPGVAVEGVDIDGGAGLPAPTRPASSNRDATSVFIRGLTHGMKMGLRVLAQISGTPHVAIADDALAVDEEGLGRARPEIQPQHAVRIAD